jgi:hypothetical protein
MHMAEENTAAAPADAPAIVDFDALGDWGAQVYDLKHPFKFAGVTYQALKLRVATGLDVTKFWQAKDGASMVKFAVGLLTTADGQPLDLKVFAKMHAEDASAIISAASDFLGKPQ